MSDNITYNPGNNAMDATIIVLSNAQAEILKNICNVLIREVELSLAESIVVENVLQEIKRNRQVASEEQLSG